MMPSFIAADCSCVAPPSFVVSFACGGMTALARTDLANLAAVVGIAAVALEPTRASWAGTALDGYRVAAPGGLVSGGAADPND